MWSSPRVFARAVPRLEGLGHRVVAPALPFHDRDPALPPVAEVGNLSLADYVAFLKTVVAGLPAPPVLLGHSMGGVLAQLLAAELPHAGLVLIAPGPTAKTNVPAPAAVRTFARIVTSWGWWNSPTRIGWAAAAWGIYNGVPEDIARADWQGLQWDSGRALAEMIFMREAVKLDYGRLDRPALVIVGQQDRTTGAGIARATARQLAGDVDYHEIPGVGHWPWWGENETLVLGLIAEWLGRLDG